MRGKKGLRCWFGRVSLWKRSEKGLFLVDMIRLTTNLCDRFDRLWKHQTKRKLLRELRFAIGGVSQID